MKNRISLALNMLFASLKYTAPSFVTSMINIISSLTFIFAVGFRWVTEVRLSSEIGHILQNKSFILLDYFFFFTILSNRLEAVDVKNPRGLAKIFGTVLSLTGALIMILYKGRTIQSLQGAPFHIGEKMAHNNWIKGSLLTVASCISWSLWYILQVYLSTVKYIYTFSFPCFSVLPWWGIPPNILCHCWSIFPSVLLVDSFESNFRNMRSNSKTTLG